MLDIVVINPNMNHADFSVNEKDHSVIDLHDFTLGDLRVRGRSFDLREHWGGIARIFCEYNGDLSTDNTVDHPYMLAEIYVPPIDTKTIPTGQRDASGQEITKTEIVWPDLSDTRILLYPIPGPVENAGNDNKEEN